LPDSRAEIFGEGGTANIDGLIERLEAGEFDLAAVGRALIANPDWANKVRDDAFEELVAFEKEMLFSLK
jgi:2,4-dienoyl-CoA reductase-like NADH-dependent reductase (Old Yellow Enzyme family)